MQAESGESESMKRAISAEAFLPVEATAFRNCCWQALTASAGRRTAWEAGWGVVGAGWL